MRNLSTLTPAQRARIVAHFGQEAAEAASVRTLLAVSNLGNCAKLAFFDPAQSREVLTVEATADDPAAVAKLVDLVRRTLGANCDVVAVAAGGLA